MILICTNEIAGPTGYHKSVVELANGLHRAGQPVALLNFLGDSDGSDRMLPSWPLDEGLQAFTLRSLPAEGGRLLHRNYHDAFTGAIGGIRYGFTANQLAALRQLNATLSEEDTLVFTSPLESVVFKHALGNDTRRPRTVLQIHGDYAHHVELRDALIESRAVIDRLQTVASGLRSQFIPLFADEDVVFIPNFSGARDSGIERVDHDGINIVFPGSFQSRKNQLDAVRALKLIDDESVHLTLWGNANPLNPYCVAVRQLAEDLGVSERVQLPGFGSEHDIYSTADIVLMTSLSEGFGYPLIEAGNHGLPAVAYDFEFGPRDAIDDGHSGYIVSVGDVDGLAKRLSALASSDVDREAFGRRSRELFVERFANDAVVEQYNALLGTGGSAIDLVDVFSAEGGEPVHVTDIRHTVRRSGVKTVHQVIVTSPIELHDIEIDNGERVTVPKSRRELDTTILDLDSGDDEVISYTTSPGSVDRHYLANTRGRELEVLPYLRRDAGYQVDSATTVDTVSTVSGGAKKLSVADMRQAFASAPKDVLWKLRQLASTGKSRSRTDAPPRQAPLEREQSTTPSDAAPRQGHGGGQPVGEPRNKVAAAVGVPGASSRSLRRMAASLFKAGTQAVVMRLAVVSPAPSRRAVERHPWFPVTSGVDNFGIALNQPGGVEVTNDGTALRPIVSIKGEYDWLVLRDASAERRVAPPFSYGEMFERICAAERDFGLFEITTSDGIHLWELGRAALVIQLAEAFGMWGAAPPIGTPVRDVYSGPKRLSAAEPARRVVFDYSRRGGSDYRTAAFRGDTTMFVVQPEPNGYPEVDDRNNVYPLHEFNQWRQSSRRRWMQLRAPEVDARPFEEALSSTLGVRVDLGTHLRSRLHTFLDQRDFWTPVFARVKPEEVLISSSHWWSGVSVAAQRAGAVVSDIQYAETGTHHPTFWFGSKPHHGATRLYAWSEFWAARTNTYEEHVIVPRQQPELLAAAIGDAGETLWDVCIVSQPRVLRRILAFVQELVRERPGLNVVIAPHPAQRPVIRAELAAAGLAEKVKISEKDTLSTMQRAAVCVGGYSTSLWEAASIGKPTYVIPLPGYELTLPDIESGLFRLARSPHDLLPYDVPEIRHAIFGNV